MTFSSKRVVLNDNGLQDNTQHALIKGFLDLSPEVSFYDLGLSAQVSFPDSNRERPERERELHGVTFTYHLPKRAQEHVGVNDKEFLLANLFVATKDFILRVNEVSCLENALTEFGTIDLTLFEYFSKVEIGSFNLKHALISGVRLEEEPARQDDPKFSGTLIVEVSFTALLV